MVMILCDINDGAALWVAGRLQERGIVADLLTASAMGAATGWEHRIEGHHVATRITLADGRIIDSAAPEPIFNRLSYIPTERLRSIAGADFNYAQQELYALYLSWLASWPALVINRAVPQGLCGNFRHPAEWSRRAQQAGLPGVTWRQSSADAPNDAWLFQRANLVVYVCCGAVVTPSPLPEALHDGCCILARDAGCDLLGITFKDADGAWQMMSATPFPDLMSGGPPLADALARAFSK